jgi:hypothetical protein
MNDTPMMWTARGNVPVDSLRYEKSWSNDGAHVWFHEFWYFADGELARNNAHGCAVQNLTIPSNDVTVALEGIGLSGQQAAMQ